MSECIVYPLTLSDPYLPVRRSFLRYVMPKLSGSALKVYLHLLDVTYDRVMVEGQPQWVFTTRQAAERQVADALELSRASVSTALDDLLRIGLIVRVSPGTRTEGATYRVCLDIEVRVFPDDHIEIVPAGTSPGGLKIDPHGDTGGSKIDPLNSRGGSKIDPQVDQKLIHLIKEEKEKEDIYARATPWPEPTQQRGRSERLTGPSQMELEGYSPEPPTAASRAVGAPPLPEASYLKRLPGTLERMGLDPARMRAMAQLPAGELSVPGIYSGDRGRAFTHGASYPMYLWMLNVLALVCGENLTSGESTTLAEPLWRTAREWVDEGRTPPQLWARFGDPEGYWYASEDHGWKGKRPTVTDVGRKWRAAGESWARRTAGTPAAAGGAKEAAADDGSDGAWAAVMKAISRYGRYRQTEILDALDEITRAAVRAVGLSRLMDVDPDDGRGLRDTRRMFTAEYREQRRRLDGRTQMVAQAAD